MPDFIMGGTGDMSGMSSLDVFTTLGALDMIENRSDNTNSAPAAAINQ
jgi:hypothetical protein